MRYYRKQCILIFVIISLLRSMLRPRVLIEAKELQHALFWKHVDERIDARV